MRKILLVGNPNTGKTTLFNTIAKAGEHAGNWHGVTVAVKEKKFKMNGEEYVLCDLPGIYSLDFISKEEELSVKHIFDNINQTIICILDANNLKRNLYLALEILSITKNVVFAVNMAKENKDLDSEKLEEILGAPVVKIDARSKKSVKKLLSILCDFYNRKKISYDTFIL